MYLKRIGCLLLTVYVSFHSFAMQKEISPGAKQQKTIILQSNDGRQFTVGRNRIDQASTTIRTILEDISDEAIKLPIPLFNIDGNTLESIIACTTDPDAMHAVIISLGTAQLLNFINAIDYLGMHELYARQPGLYWVHFIPTVQPALLEKLKLEGESFNIEDCIIDKLLHDDIAKIESLTDFLKVQGKVSKDLEDCLLCVTLKCGIQGVFKPFKEEAILAEVAAYKASRFLGLCLVPPTVLRTIGKQVGSLQLFIHTNVDTRARGVFEHVVSQAIKTSPDELANLKIFHYIFGQCYFSPRNVLVNGEKGRYTFIAIDNEDISKTMYWRYGDNAFLAGHCRELQSSKIKHKKTKDPVGDTKQYEHFPYEAVHIIKHPTSAAIKELFPKLSSKHVKRLCEIQPLHFVWYQDALWVQRRTEPCFAYTTYYQEETIRMLKKLDISMLHHIFSDARGAKFLTEEYLRSILERRDQVLAHYELHKRHKQ